MTEFSMTEPRPMTEPSQIRLFLTVAPAIREQRQETGPGEDRTVLRAKSNGGSSRVSSMFALWNAPTVPMSSQ